LSAAAERCPQAQITPPNLGDGAALLRYTTVVSLPDGTQAAAFD
jgi:hypothetical protein